VREKPEHEAAVKAHRILPIDMVVVNLYAFEKTAARPGAAFEEVIENIDIGGPSMVRSAAKNFEDVAIVTSAADYAALEEELNANGGGLTRETRWLLARAAFAVTAAYDTAIANTLERIASPEPAHAAVQFLPEKTAPFPATLRISYPLASHLRYGENPHQRAALYSDGSGKGVAGATQHHGKELSYNNLVDLDACWDLVREFDEPAVAIIKHTNPCGAATASSLVEAYRRALSSDPISAFGGVIGVNRELNLEAAEEMAKLFVEAIAAPSFAPDALARLQTKKNLRLIELRPADASKVIKQVSGGLLLQDADSVRTTPDELQVVTARKPTQEELHSLLFAWRVCKHVKSNAIVYAKDAQTLGVGAGQMSRVDAAKFGAMKAVLPLAGCVAASDAFFPFPDGLEAVAAAGATAVIQPGGSVKDGDVIAAADKLGIAMVFTGIRHFRH
jgi:phosphoribosylaminoimidazolecarboxamide formyltransferase / IMP cyclohydrolase